MVGSLPGWLWKTLEKIPCTEAPYKSLSYRPASAALKDGTVEPCVVFFGSTTFQRKWGPSRGRKLLPFTDVVDILPSPNQLPPEFAYKLYRQGETRMGSTDFTLTMKDGREFYYTLGNLVDFINYPPGYDAGDVASVKSGYIREHGKSEGVLHGPSYAWCLYQESSATLEKIRNEKEVG